MATVSGDEQASGEQDTSSATSVSGGAANPINGDDLLESLLTRIRELAPKPTAATAAPAPAEAKAPASIGEAPKKSKAPEAARSTTKNGEFFPIEPHSYRAAGLSHAEVEELSLKLLLARPDQSGHAVAGHLRLPFALLDELLRQMRTEQLVVHKGSAPMNDFVYQLTDLGRERARRLNEYCTYYGSAPVPLADYIESVKAQSLTQQHPSAERLKQAFSDLLINERMLSRLGPAINSGRGMFLYGSAGNGKTSIAERVTRAFGEYIWIPRAVSIDGEALRIFDPTVHEEAPLAVESGLLDERQIDQRWVRIHRPTIVVGGELTMESLEVTMSAATGIHEAPVQMKSNCGTLVIDDFGRQRMSTSQLLNRWIVPLEKRFDFLNLASGKKIQVPFDQLIIFSTNLQPKDLCDEAFLRRIPYKIEVNDPTEDEFRELFELMAPKMGFEFREDVFRDLVDRHYKANNRPFRCCHPRDLLLQVSNYCHYHKESLELSIEKFDYAVENYFAVM